MVLAIEVTEENNSAVVFNASTQIRNLKQNKRHNMKNMQMGEFVEREKLGRDTLPSPTSGERRGGGS